jgi:hypothetical protein
MRLFDLSKIADNGKISYERLEKVIKECKFIQKDMEANFCEAKKFDDILLEEITNYDDIYNKISYNQRQSMYVYKDKVTNKQYMMCFKPTDEMARFRSIKQKLADTTTSYIIQKMSDANYELFLFTFYKSVNTIITSYANHHNLEIPKHICFFYKGGNLYRILLKELFSLLDDNEFTHLLKRSDADFQLFVNPTIPNYKKVFEDISILVTFCLYSFKSVLQKNDFGISDINIDTLLKEYRNDLGNKDIKFVDKTSRMDFMLAPINLQGDEFVMYKEVSSLLEAIPKHKPSNFFISRNTAIKFRRKDNTYNSFDLYRMKYNVKINVNDEILSVPSEVIDVGIPKPDDNTISSLIKKADKWLTKYHYDSTISKKSFTFWGPTLSYMIKDIDLILFYQNDFPWHDKKIDKRLQRYFLCLILHSIVATDNNPVMNLNNLKKELHKLIKFLTCFNEGNCEAYGDENISGLFYVKYKKISNKLNNIKNKSTLAQEIRDFREFNDKVISIVKKMISMILKIIANTPPNKLENIIKKVKLLHTTSYLGGQ